ncbi:hypothetical protein Q1W73_09795 [Asticcacaulis sp. ZE23SCel15]|uniref:hypothetical protein n=1 Tax=Asticcacaulis sp. ZE23SCel15 TaxID=3059027 RepID=UPI0026603B55|nr:hypothetical protein [Asticcacaulis sp. ZE23SCel15]WKL55994.1 hypothetical protein Q1W73_09795 [Asticcacaulis sp. ZE23SCel15]
MKFDLTSNAPVTLNDLGTGESLFIRCTCGHSRETTAGALQASNLGHLKVMALHEFFICGNMPCGGDITVSRSSVN